MQTIESISGNQQQIPTFLPGQLLLTPGQAKDYRPLARFHYCQGAPATWAGVWVIRYTETNPTPHAGFGAPATTRISSAPADTTATDRVIAVAVLSYPTVNSTARDAALNLTRFTPRRRLAFINANLRTISRIIVHPQFRGLGLAARLVHHLCHQCPTRFVEAFAVMGRVHPFFEKGGMTPHPSANNAPVYYTFRNPSL